MRLIHLTQEMQKLNQCNQKGQTMKANDGNEYKWMGALWVNTATNKPNWYYVQA